MILQRTLLGVVLATAVIFACVSVLSQDILAASVSAVIGLIWLIQEVHGKTTISTAYFVAFVGFAALGGLNHAPLPLILLGLCTDLAAWDLSRFQQRIRDEETSDEKTFLEHKHLQKLAAVTSVGFLIALVPMLIQISVNFVILLLIMLLALIALRQSILSLRGDNSGNP
jgi:hypothetical protein